MTAIGDATLYVSSACECVDVRSETTLRERRGLVTDESGQPLARARLQIVRTTHSGVAYTDSEGRFRVRVPVRESWPLTASATGFITATQQVSGIVEPVVFKLRRSGTPIPDIERFYRVCCPSDLFTSDGR
jgi:carboxypeptidase family protein